MAPPQSSPSPVFSLCFRKQMCYARLCEIHPLKTNNLQREDLRKSRIFTGTASRMVLDRAIRPAVGHLNPQMAVHPGSLGGGFLTSTFASSSLAFHVMLNAECPPTGQNRHIPLNRLRRMIHLPVFTRLQRSGSRQSLTRLPRHRGRVGRPSRVARAL